MNPYTALQKGSFRNLLTIVVPGTIAAAPYLVLLKVPERLQDYLETTGTAAPAWQMIAVVWALLVAIVTAGMIADGLGRWWEHLWDCIFRKFGKNKDRFSKEKWNDYLKTTVKTGGGSEIVAHGYLSNLILRFRFELNITAALFLCLIGLVSLQCTDVPGPIPPPCLLWVTSLALFYFAFVEVTASVKLLAETRELIIGGSEKPEENDSNKTAKAVQQ